MRRKPSSQNGGYNQHRSNKPRYQGGHSNGSHSQGGQHNRPRRNYTAAREKYLQQFQLD